MAQMQSGVDSTLLTIDPTSKAARVTFYDTLGNPLVYKEDDAPAAPSGILVMGQNDQSILPVRLDRFGSIGTTFHTPMFMESFEGTTINPIRWNILSTTMAATQSSVFGVSMNSSAITTINTGYMLRSNRAFYSANKQPIFARSRCRLDHYNNAVIEMGLGDAASSNAVNTTGAFWRKNASGALIPVLTFNSSDLTGTDVSGLVNNTGYYIFDVLKDDDKVTFTIQNSSTGQVINKQVMRVPLTATRIFSTTQIYGFARLYITGTAPATAPRFYVTEFYVGMLDGNLGLPASNILALQHRTAIDEPRSGATLQAWSNSAEPASATLSNTAAGYTTLGGKFQFAAVAGAVTDYALFGFQVPAPCTLVVTGIDIETWNTGAAVAGTPTLLTWGIKTNLSAVSLATTTGNPIGLGAQSLPVGAAIGATAQRISKNYTTPIVCGPGRFIDIILRMPVGTATASQVIAGMVNVEGYFI